MSSTEESKTATFTGTVLVIGSSGTIGSAAVTALSSAFGSGATIKAGTRNPDSDKAKELSKLAGVTAVKADAGDAASVAEVRAWLCSACLVVLCTVRVECASVC